MSADPAALLWVTILTLFVGAFTGVIPRAGIFDPEERRRMRYQMQGRPAPERRPRERPSRGQLIALAVFFVSEVVLIFAGSAVQIAAVCLVFASLAALIALSVRQALKRRHG